MAAFTRTLSAIRRWRLDPEPTFWSGLSRDEKASSINQQIFRTIDGICAWDPEGPVLHRWNTVMFPVLEICLQERSNDILAGKQFNGSMNCFMCGPRPERALPTVVITDSDSEVCRRLRNAFAETVQYRTSGFEIHCTRGTLRLNARPVTSNTGNSPGTTMKSIMPPSVLGAPFISLGDVEDGVSRTATIAAVVRAYDRDYALTIAHVFATRSRKRSATDSLQHPVTIKCATPDFLKYYEATHGTQSCNEVQVGTAFVDNEQLYCFDRDWALLTPTRNESFYNVLRECSGFDQHVYDLKESDDPPKGSVIVASDEGGFYKQTTASGALALISLPSCSTICKVFTIRTNLMSGKTTKEKPLSSGSLVLDGSGKAFGMVVADSPEFNVTYVMPIGDIFDDISKALRPSPESPIRRPYFTQFQTASSVGWAYGENFDSYRGIKDTLDALERILNPLTPLSFIPESSMLEILRARFRVAVNLEWNSRRTQAKTIWLKAMMKELEDLCSIDAKSGRSVYSVLRGIRDRLSHWSISGARGRILQQEKFSEQYTISVMGSSDIPSGGSTIATTDSPHPSTPGTSVSSAPESTQWKPTELTSLLEQASTPVQNAEDKAFPRNDSVNDCALGSAIVEQDLDNMQARESTAIQGTLQARAPDPEQ
ncbi:hypothetical protein FH972_021404 [Carpinus fangiana]|uniref:Uncharacterized protein n=1 Tax=Carpinus fangiana TaxID=176857 RepID=A0A5N6KPW0_9ROSI|nr:hypothetical protein FH972_021404 [Carpinus fangiana]